MDVLPTEVLEKIFGYLSVKDRVLGVRPTCRRFAEIVDASSEWKNYALCCIWEKDQDLTARMLENMPSLQRLSYHISGPLTDAALSKFHGCLREFSVTRTHNVSAVTEIIIRSKNTLELLFISGDLFYYSFCAKAIAECTNLKELNVEHLFYSNGSCKNPLMLIANGCPRLKILEFCSCNFSEDNLRNFLQRKRVMISERCCGRKPGFRDRLRNVDKMQWWLFRNALKHVGK